MCLRFGKAIAAAAALALVSSGAGAQRSVFPQPYGSFVGGSGFRGPIFGPMTPATMIGAGPIGVGPFAGGINNGFGPAVAPILGVGPLGPGPYGGGVNAMNGPAIAPVMGAGPVGFRGVGPGALGPGPYGGGVNNQFGPAVGPILGQGNIGPGPYGGGVNNQFGPATAPVGTQAPILPNVSTITPGTNGQIINPGGNGATTPYAGGNGYVWSPGYPPGYDYYGNGYGEPAAGYPGPNMYWNNVLPRTSDAIDARVQNNGTILIRWQGDPTVVNSITFALLDRNRQPITQQTITRLPPQATLKLTNRTDFYEVVVHYVNGTTSTVISPV